MQKINQSSDFIDEKKVCFMVFIFAISTINLWPFRHMFSSIVAEKMRCAAHSNIGISNLKLYHHAIFNPYKIEEIVFLALDNKIKLNTRLTLLNQKLYRALQLSQNIYCFMGFVKSNRIQILIEH